MSNTCKVYTNDEVLPDGNGNCSLCGGNCTDNCWWMIGPFSQRWLGVYDHDGERVLLSDDMTISKLEKDLKAVMQ